MKQTFILCEGPTELQFVRSVLAPDLPGIVLHAVLPRKIGGNINFSRVKIDILAALKQNSEHRCTTLFDYYGLRDFPGLEASKPKRKLADKAATIEAQVEAQIAAEFGASFNPARFKAHLSMYEFEGLLFSDPAALAAGVYRPELAPEL